MAVADFDGDGNLDLAATADVANNVRVLRGDGTGSFTAAGAFAVGTSPRGIVTGDFNGDALPDLATANSTGTVSVLLNTTPYLMRALTWGDGSNGSLGNGGTTNSSTPVGVQNLTELTAVSAGMIHMAALTAGGEVWTWGANFNGALGIGPSGASSVPVHVAGVTGIVAISVGHAHSLAMDGAGNLHAWGLNSFGQLGDGSTNDSMLPVAVGGLSGVIAFSAGAAFSLALKADGTVWAWGRNNFGQLGDGTLTHRSTPVQVSGLTGVVAIDASGSGWHALAVRADGSVRAWGRNDRGQLGDGTLIDRLTPVAVGTLSGVRAVAAGTGHSAVVKADGTVWSWGLNHLGQLGNGTLADSLTPVQASGITAVRSVTVGQTHTIVLRADGTAWGWGANSFSGQLGNGTLINSSTAVKVSNVSAAKALATGGQHSAVIVSAPTVPGLISMVPLLNAAPGIANGLVARLHAAQHAIESGNTSAACGQITGFVNQLEARSLHGTLAADDLIAAARRFQAPLGCAVT